MNKLLFVLFAACMILAGCSKPDPDMVYVGKTAPSQIDSKATGSPVAARSSAFPISIYLGEDTVCNRITSIRLWEYSCYLPTCGMQPELEAPEMGVKIYQIAGPTQTIISWANWNDYQEVPVIQGLEPGNYKFVGHAWVYGFRPCDSSYRNDNAYDTISITVLKKRAKVKP